MNSALRTEATQLITSEREFLLQLFNEKDEVKLLYRLTHATSNQVKCIIFILYLIVKKQIPIRRNVFNKMPLKVLKDLKTKFDHPFQSIYDEGREQHMSQIITIYKFIPELIEPLVKKVPKLNK